MYFTSSSNGKLAKLLWIKVQTRDIGICDVMYL